MEENINNRKVWAIIPARGGSKGVLKKNIKNFCGDSLLSRAINCLNDSQCFEKIIVTSDDPEILDVARKYGAEPHCRKKEIESRDDVMTDIPVLSFLKQIPENNRPDFSFMIQCTAPFMSPEKYQKAVQMGFALSSCGEKKYSLIYSYKFLTCRLNSVIMHQIIH